VCLDLSLMMMVMLLSCVMGELVVRNTKLLHGGRCGCAKMPSSHDIRCLHRWSTRIAASQESQSEVFVIVTHNGSHSYQKAPTPHSIFGRSRIRPWALEVPISFPVRKCVPVLEHMQFLLNTSITHLEAGAHEACLGEKGIIKLRLTILIINIKTRI
jgi:hypothetical protein